MLNQLIKEQIQELYTSKIDSGVNAVFIGYKTKNNIRTNEICVVFGVEEKKSESNLSVDHILPKNVIIDGLKTQTDVVTINNVKLMSCYPSGDQNISRLSYFPTTPVPLKGGMGIAQFPTSWVPINGGYKFEVGTIGFFAKDNIDGRVVAVTNAHVAIENWLISSDRNIEEEINNPYNTCEKIIWLPNNNLYYPSGCIFSSNTGLPFNIQLPFERIKRYEPMYKTSANYIDCALLITKPEYIDDNSYQVWQPINQTTYPSSMPFATTAELDNIMTTNPTVYCTGRTSGPVGWGSGDCKINITGIGLTLPIGTPFGAISYSDQMIMQTPSNTSPMAGGDSGSCVMADIGGVRKIIGLMFAGGDYGTGSISIFNRIDRVADEMKISAFTSPVDTLVPTAKLYSASLDTYGGSKSIVLNGKLYYQAGLTKNVYSE
jgi:hypothetical protein